MESATTPFQYDIADGPEGLSRLLEKYLERVKSDEEFAKEEHYILYSLGEQRSYIKLDMSQWPFQFWYSDLLGRPATRIVKDTIADFLWEKCGEKERFMKDNSSE